MHKLMVIFALLASLATSSNAQLGSPTSDLVFTPVTPCRILDTRLSSGGSGSIAAGGTKVFAVRDTASFASQGGSSSNCNLNASTNIASIAVYLTVVTPASAGWITAYPSNVALPLAATVNFKAGDVLGNTTIVGVSQTSSPSLAIYSSSVVDVVGDVVGYFSKPVATALQCVVTGINQTALAASASGAVFPPACAAGFTPVATFCDVSAFEVSLIPLPTGCAGRNNTASAQAIFSSQRCCQIPGR